MCLKLLKENFTEDEVKLIKANLLDDYPDYWPEEAVMRFFEQAMTDDSVLDDNGYVAADKVPRMKDNLLKLFNDLAYQINNGEEGGQIRADERRVPEINKGKEALAMRNSEGTESLAAGEESETRFRINYVHAQRMRTGTRMRASERTLYSKEKCRPPHKNRLIKGLIAYAGKRHHILAGNTFTATPFNMHPKKRLLLHNIDNTQHPFP